MLRDEILKEFANLLTPAWVFEESVARSQLRKIGEWAQKHGFQLLYPLKPNFLPQVLGIIASEVSGFSVSSYFECCLAREASNESSSIHFTSPSLRPDEIERIAELCDSVSFNSLSQLRRFKHTAEGRARVGLRVNPQLSFVADERYNPSRTASKLGVPLTDLVKMASNGIKDKLKGVSGVHFHNNTDSTNFSQLLQTVEHLDLYLGEWLNTLDWINLGGGYLFDEGVDLTPFHQAIDLLRSKHGLEVFIEPGATIVRDAGFIVSSVVDLFLSDGKQIAVLDTTVNHMPEVFEYQYEPDVLGHTEDGEYSYILAGASCLAGDLFGEYSFKDPLKFGSRVVFTGMGAYTLVKAHMFNGINLPTIYSLTDDGELILEKEFTYEDFASRNGLEIHDHA